MAHIKTYARIKPTKSPSRLLDHGSTQISIGVPRLQPSGQTRDRTATLTHEFGFGGVFGPTCSQDEVFDLVASHIVDGFLTGYNGTIFAYGQTGSGKTFTIEGGTKFYSERGLAPRALSRIYKSLENQKFAELSIKVSYLEIYQEVGYDLLNPTTRPGNVVTHLPKVTVTEGAGGSCVVRGLSAHLAADERVAQTLLLQGQTTRRVAETPMNQRSSRSHAVFTVHLTARHKGSDTVTRSKLHLVDLAGSERVAKTKIAGQQLHEAKAINLSLHHLEGVIVALQGGARQGNRGAGGARKRARSAGPVRNKRVSSASSVRSLPYQRSQSIGGGVAQPRHIPYRNSLLTMVLRDSLGGNCLTAMIATVSAEHENLSESLSTCRFAMRVAAVQNKISRNEVLDDRTVIARLRKRISMLEEEIIQLKTKLSEDKHQQDQAHSANSSHLHSQDQSTHPVTSPAIKPHPSLVGSPRTPIVPANGSGLDREGRRQCAKLMQGFVSGRLRDPVAAGVSDFSRFRECLRLMKEMILRSYAYHQKYNPTIAPEQPHPVANAASEKYPSEVKRSPEETNSRQRPKSSGERGSSRGYKSPFERKQEKDISRLGRTVEARAADQKKQKRDLLEFKTLLKQQQLENAVSDLRYKMETTRKHLGKQQELVGRLRENRASREQITAERIAEKQLVKRLTKYEKRMQLILEHLQIVRNHMELHQRASNKTSQSEAGTPLTDQSAASDSQVGVASSQHGESPNGDDIASNQSQIMLDGVVGENASPDQSQALLNRLLTDDGAGDQSEGLKERIIERCRHKSGKVDSRRVLDILHMEDKKHQKLEKNLSKERIQNFNQHFALKEEATRSKLQHFKEQLRLHKEAMSSGSDQVTGMGGSCDNHVTGMGQICDDHVKAAWSSGNVTQQGQAINQSSNTIDHATKDQAVIGGERTTHRSHQPIGMQDDSGRSLSYGEIKHSSSDRCENANGNKSKHNQYENTHSSSITDHNITVSISQPTYAGTYEFDETSLGSSSNLLTSTPLPNGANASGILYQSPGVDNDGNFDRQINDSSNHSNLRGDIRSISPYAEGNFQDKLSNENELFSLPLDKEQCDISSRHDPSSAKRTASSKSHSRRSLPNDGLPINHRASSMIESQSRINVSTPPLDEAADAARAPLNSQPAKLSEDRHSKNSHMQIGSVGSIQSSMSLESSSSTLQQDPLDNHHSGISSSNLQLGSLSTLRTNSWNTFLSDGTATPPETLDGGFQASSGPPTLLLQDTDSLASDPGSSGGRRDSFDAALATMLQTAAGGRRMTSESLSTTSQKKSVDVTSALKSKLLDYLGGKPSQSTSSSLPNQWTLPHSKQSLHDDNGDGLPKSGESIAKQVNGHGHADPLMHPSFKMGGSTSTLSSVPEGESISQREGSAAFGTGSKTKVNFGSDPQFVKGSKVKALEETEGERSYVSAAKENKARIKKIRKAINSAEVIQRAWRKYKSK